MNNFEIAQPLLPTTKTTQNLPFKNPSWLRSFILRIKSLFVLKISHQYRFISFNGIVSPPTFFENIVKNQKYSIITFLPLVLFNQFKYFFNLFFLLIGISQFYEPLRVGLIFTYIAPLVFVLSLTALKELLDDYQRYKKDKEANSVKYRVFKKNKIVWKLSSELKVGDIIGIDPNQRIPADLLLIYTSDESETVFVRTDQLDGETDWKLRIPINYSQKLLKNNSVENLMKSDYYINIMPPIGNIYAFEGNLEENNQQKEPLTLEQTLWANCVLASASIMGIVIYTGKETRFQMNSQKARTKIGRIDLLLNTLSKYLFVFMLFQSAIMVFLNGIPVLNVFPLLLFFRYILLLSSIIPISMRVNLDFAKIIYSRNIDNDKEIPGTKTRNSVIPEDLGLISHLLTDKTGTLTRNEMKFKRLSLEDMQFTEEQLDLLKDFFNNYYKIGKNKLAASEIIGNSKFGLSASFNKLSQSNKLRIRDTRIKISKRIKTILIDTIRAFSLCHNVIPNDNDNNFQASSPDEVALVDTALMLGIKLVSRTQKFITIETNIKREKFEILANFPFSSERKRMGLLLRDCDNPEEIIFLLKGADIVMKDTVPEVKRGFILDECEKLANVGLRTLVLTQKKLNVSEYKRWNTKYREAQMAVDQRELKISKIVEELEKDMDFLGIVAVEDRLQENISKTIENLRNAGIKIWMLTGDKAETAKCIAISTAIKERTHEIFEILDKEIQNDSAKLEEKLKLFSTDEVSSKNVLLIDGTILSLLMKTQADKFFKIAVQAPAVICSRCAPTQKALIAKNVKKYSGGGQVAAIGDGGNDVAMIQEADVGIGITGKEGLQAALASDFSIEHFKFLETLLIWHGRLSYKRSAALSQFVIHRGLIISVLQTVFTCSFYFVAIPIYNGLLMLGYSTIYTTLPVFSLIFDEDVDKKTALEFPTLYGSLQKGRYLSGKTLLSWIWKSLYQGSVIFLASLSMFDNAFVNIVTITFSSLILTEFLNVYTEINRVTKIMIAAQTCSIIIYFSSILFLNSIFNVKFMGLDFIIKILIITLISWLPLHLLKIFLRWFDPTDYEKIRNQAKLKRKIKAEIQTESIITY